jgi:Domain of unknown function (DUF1848).
MIVSASRRTDIPAFYADWFFERVREGFALVPNPFNARQVRRVSLKPEDVDCFVFWTKNPTPMLPRLDEINKYPYYFQYTLTAYENDIEKNIPPANKRLEAFLDLAGKIGPERVIWRYDPVFLSPKYTLQYHLDFFEKAACALEDYTFKCTISFMDPYKSIEKRMQPHAPQPWTEDEMREAARSLSEIAFSHGIAMDTCAEEIDLSDMNIGHARCIDPVLIERLFHKKVDAGKDKYQRPACNCAVSVDIGMYNTCPGSCKYC